MAVGSGDECGPAKSEITRRRLFGSVVAVLVAPAERRGTSPQDVSGAYWWQRFPSFVQGEEPAVLFASGAAMAIHGMASDPTWGPYPQRLRVLESGAAYRSLRTGGMRVITWIEGFGDCMLYAAAFERRPDGEWVCRDDDASMAKVVRSHWNWTHPDAGAGTDLRWVGVHNLVNAEDFARAAAAKHRWDLPAPTYPDGRPAVGVVRGARYPLDARVYDACGSKDVNGRLYPSFEATAGANEHNGAGSPVGPTRGLYPAVPGTDDVASIAGLKAGEPVWCGVISVHKDLSAPYWREYARRSVRIILQAGIDGLWCDNYSPWDNFGYTPVRTAFGEWSVHRFRHEYLPSLPEAELRRAGIREPRRFEVRRALRATARRFGAADPTKLDDRAWSDARWLDDPVWCAYKAFRQQRGQKDLRAFYEAIHAEARAAGRPDFCVGGNDIPFYGLGWTRDAWLDMVNTEITPGWHMGTGSRGVMLPPAGKMAVVYAAAREHQKGPFAGAWYYLDGDHVRRQRQPVVGTLLQAEAFASGAFLLCDPTNRRVAGTVESHAAWNAFVRQSAPAFGNRRPHAGLGIVFSPDNQLALLTPAGYPDMDRQPHVFGHWGWATAMVDAHIPYRAVADWKLTAVGLSGLRTLVLPHVECMEDDALAALRRYVTGGGHIVATGNCGSRHGPNGRFAHRGTSWLGEAIARTLQAPQSGVRVGGGRLTAIPGTPGMDYWLNAADRSKLLGPLAAMAPSALLDGSALPTTVGAFLWREDAGDGALFVDLVNYALHPQRDEVAPTAPLSFRVRVPVAWKGVELTVLSPVPVHATLASLQEGWADVRVASLPIYASVRLARRPPKPRA